MFRVVATRQGFYNQRLREPGEVFDLLRKRDGSYRQAYTREPIRTKEGVVVPGQFKKIPVAAKDGNGRPIKAAEFVAEHEDYAEDKGNVAINDGPNAGENIHLGWMYKVPDHVPVGQYPEGTNFWAEHMMIPQPFVQEVAPGGTVSKGSAPIKDYDDQAVRVIAPGTREGAKDMPRPPGMS